MWSAFRPRALSSSSTSRNESEYRRYQRTAQRISSGSVCRHLKIAGRIVFFMISSGYPPPSGQSCNTTGPGDDENIFLIKQSDNTTGQGSMTFSDQHGTRGQLSLAVHPASLACPCRTRRYRCPQAGTWMPAAPGGPQADFAENGCGGSEPPGACRREARPVRGQLWQSRPSLQGRSFRPRSTRTWYRARRLIVCSPKS